MTWRQAILCNLIPLSIQETLFKKIFCHIYIFFYWKILVSQSCISFRYTTMCISCMYTYIRSLSDLPPTLPPYHPSRSSQRRELSCLCFAAGSHQLSVSHMVVCICQAYSPSSSHPHLPLPCPPLHSLHLRYLEKVIIQRMHVPQCSLQRY